MLWSGRRRSITWRESLRCYLIAETRLISVFRSTFYKEALRTGLYEFEAARNWYREVSQPDYDGQGMHSDLIFEWIKLSALLVQPIIPHFSEYVWQEIVGEKDSVQKALWPQVEGQGEVASTEEEESVLKQLEYMRGVIGSMRSAESAVAKKKTKGKSVAYDPSKPRSARIFVATKYPEWQSKVMEVLEGEFTRSSNSEAGEMEDKEMRKGLEERGLLKDKKAMPFLQAMKVRWRF